MTLVQIDSFPLNFAALKHGTLILVVVTYRPLLFCMHSCLWEVIGFVQGNECAFTNNVLVYFILCGDSYFP